MFSAIAKRQAHVPYRNSTLTRLLQACHIRHISYIYIHICLIPKCIMHTGVPERRRQGAGAVCAIARAGLGARELVHAPLLLAHQVSFLALSVLYIVHARRGPIVCLCLCLCLLCVCVCVCVCASVLSDAALLLAHQPMRARQGHAPPRPRRRTRGQG